MKQKKKKLLFICQHFYPEVFRGNDIAFDLARRGVDVTVICGIPNYPGGEFFPGYGILTRTREVVNGVRIIRIPIIPRGRGNKLQLALNFFSYSINACCYLPFHLIMNRSYDACFVQQLTPVMMSMPGILFKKLMRKKLYTWVLDLWPESLKAAGGIDNPHVLGFFNGFAKSEYRNSDIIFVSSRGFEENISAKGDYGHKIRFLPNWAEEEISNGQKMEIPQLPEGFNVVFAGNIGEAQDFENIVAAARLLNPQEGINIIIIGDGRKKEWVESEILKHALQDRVKMLGRFDIKYMTSFFDAADALLLSLKDDEILNLTVPAKVQAYMTAGKPIVAMINGDAHRLINDTGCGIAVEASNPAKLAQAIRTLKDTPTPLLAEMGAKGKTYCEQHYDRSKILDNLYSMIITPMSHEDP